MTLRTAFAYVALTLAALAMAAGLHLFISAGLTPYAVGLLVVGFAPLLVLQRRDKALYGYAAFGFSGAAGLVALAASAARCHVEDCGRPLVNATAALQALSYIACLAVSFGCYRWARANSSTHET
jgi:hypothetical protein